MGLDPVQYKGPFWLSPTNQIMFRGLDGTLRSLGPLLPAATLNVVATNSAKLTLTGITAGYSVQITGEANRIEMFRGGATPSQDAQWAVLHNTVNLLVVNFSSTDVQVNGVDCPEGAQVNIGWVDPNNLDVEGPSDNVSLASLGYASQSTDYGFEAVNYNIEAGAFAIPIVFPDRQYDAYIILQDGNGP